MINRLNINPFRRRSGVGVCSILATAKQYISLWVDNLLTDTLGRGYLQPLQSWAFKLNGTNQYFDMAQKQEGGAIDFECQFRLNSNANQGIFSNGGFRTTAGNKGLTLIVLSGKLELWVHDGLALQRIMTNHTTVVGEYTVKGTHSGINGDLFHLSINGFEYTQAINIWAGLSEMNMFFGAYNQATPAGFAKATLLMFRYNNLIEVPFSIGKGDTVYNLWGNTAHACKNWVDESNWAKQDEYHFNITNGFNKIGDTYIPASRTNLGFDALGNPLSNPAVNGHNGAETLLKQGDDTVKLIDTHNEWFNTSGVAIEHSFATLPANGSRVVGKATSTSKTHFLTFDHDLTTDEKNQIQNCI